MMHLFEIAISLAAAGILALFIFYTLCLPADRRKTRLLGFALVALGIGLAPFSFSRPSDGVCDPRLAHKDTLTAGLCAAVRTPPDAVRTAGVKVGGHLLQVEIADTSGTRARGLMFRQSLAPRHGMLFLYRRDQRFAFWMKNTRIPLDMLFFNREGILQDVLRNVPPCKADPCPLYWPSHDYRYVIELPAGEAQRLGLASSDRLAPAAANAREAP